MIAFDEVKRLLEQIIRLCGSEDERNEDAFPKLYEFVEQLPERTPEHLTCIYTDRFSDEDFVSKKIAVEYAYHRAKSIYAVMHFHRDCDVWVLCSLAARGVRALSDIRRVVRATCINGQSKTNKD